LHIFTWGKPFAFVVARVNAFAQYVQNKRQEGDRLMQEWQKPGLPKPIIEQAQATIFNGRLLLWDWPGTIELFEQMRKQTNIPKPFWLWVSRAYLELGYMNMAVTCIDEAQLAEFGGTQQALAAALLPFFALTGAKEKVEELNLALSKGAGAIPEYTRLYWLARCLGARKESESALDTNQRALAALDATKWASPAWRRRIESQISAASGERSTGDGHSSSESRKPIDPTLYAEAVERIWRVYQNALFVQETVSPKKRSKTVIALVSIIVAMFVVFRIIVISNNNDLIGVETSIWSAWVLDSKKVLNGQYWRLVTYMFLHKDEVHVLVNAIGLLWFGRVTQNIYGTARFLGIFFLAGILGGIWHCIGQPETLVVGDSGAVMGVFGAAGVGIFRLRDYLPWSVRRNELAWLATLALSGILIDQFIPGVASFVHLGGLLSGALFGTIINVPRPAYDRIENNGAARA
jgi:membrane associated rhomboid family serine protease